MISIQHLNKHHGDKQILYDISFTIEAGETLVLLGSSGSGKTTLLKILLGLDHGYKGQVKIHNTVMTRNISTALREQLAYVPQQSNLFPHLNTLDNICISASLQKLPPFARGKRALNALAMVRLNDKQSCYKFPHQLSGGQQQRVNVARALAMKPNFLLMDEPFSALDQITKKELQDELRDIQQQLKITTLFVTHDINEAFKLADRIAILQHGKLEQIGKPSEVKNNPASEFVKKLLNNVEQSRE